MSREERAMLMGVSSRLYNVENKISDILIRPTGEVYTLVSPWLGSPRWTWVKFNRIEEVVDDNYKINGQWYKECNVVNYYTPYNDVKKRIEARVKKEESKKKKGGK